MVKEGLDANTLDGIYTEAILFVAIFGIMSIISIIISKRNAKKYELENPLDARRAARKEAELEKELLRLVPQKNDDKTSRLIELSKMLEDGTISKEEFKVLKQNLNII